MSSPNVQPQPNYKYTPSSSASTRQILDSTSSTAAPNTSAVQIPSRPANVTRRSSNYADAAAAATKKVSAAENSDGEAKPTAAAWKPNFARQQSWSRQDAKRELQMSAVGEVDEQPGYSKARADS